ncbi:MAG: hypothetical protein AAFW84_10610 [Cyanobacteria bacterium J06635_15]
MLKITQGNFITILLEHLPQINDSWVAFQQEWADNKEGIPHYLFISDIARYVVEHKDSIDLRHFFMSVERIEIYGDHYCREAITVGLLEDIQNNLLRLNIPLSHFDEFLGKETKKFWGKVIDFWEEGKLITDN